MGTPLRQDQLKYGFIKGREDLIRLNMGASEVISAQSGRFVTLDANGRGEITAASSTTIFGHVEAGAQTCSSTEGGTTVLVNTNTDAIFRLPVNSGTYVESMKGKTCDLSVASDIQGVALDASARDIVIIVDGDETNNNYVDVKMVPAKQIKTGVA